MDFERETEKARYTPGKLAAVVWPFVAVVIAQTLVASLSIYTLSAVRSYVGGESFWSKGYKQAVHALEHYAAYGDPEMLHLFDEAISVPLGTGRRGWHSMRCRSTKRLQGTA